MKLWDKGYELDKEIEKFTVGDDPLLDKNLVYWDCIASIAHSKMLHKMGILDKAELEKLVQGLKEIISLDEQGKFKISQSQEDCHTAIEQYLTEKCGDAGKKIHTFRSRNDQVAAALRLYMKSQLLETAKLSLGLIHSLVKLSSSSIPMPGYTHMRKAMPSSVKLWAGSFAESITDDLKVLFSVFDVIDSCPLGTGAGYGIPAKIDRKFTAGLLGFSGVQKNPLYVQNSRGKFEALILSSISNIMIDINKLATDMILFSMPEFGFFSLPKEFCTGSSIMPHKQNPDVLELLRAKSQLVSSLYIQVMNLCFNLPSGYNRDMQLTKKPLMEGFKMAQSCIKITDIVISGLVINKEKCVKAMTDELYATHKAYGLVKKGMPFRDAYKKAALGEGEAIPAVQEYSLSIDVEHLGKEIEKRSAFLQNAVD